MIPLDKFIGQTNIAHNAPDLQYWVFEQVVAGTQLEGKYNFVCLANNQVRLSAYHRQNAPMYQHYQLADYAESVKAAGTVSFNESGEVVRWNNLSSHYFAAENYYSEMNAAGESVFDFSLFKDVSVPRVEDNVSSIALNLKLSPKVAQRNKISFDPLAPPPSNIRKCFLLFNQAGSPDQYYLKKYLDVKQQKSYAVELLPKGEYVFVRMQNGEFRLSPREEGISAHLTLSGAAKQVMYAGVIAFKNDSGQIDWWSNQAGGYRGIEKRAGLAGLPLGALYFKPYQAIFTSPQSAPSSTMFPLTPAPSVILKSDKEENDEDSCGAKSPLTFN